MVAIPQFHRNDFTERSLTAREEIRRDALGQHLDAEGTDKLLDTLAKAGWLRREATERKGAGRPANRWSVNPKLMS
jgi:predicted ArsR family transcriptional regulator